MICDNLTKIRDRILTAVQQYKRNPDEITLLAVSKTRSVEEILEAVKAGQREFGESYASEAVPKIEALKEENLTWHFIGPIQSNKTKLIANYFDWVHSVDRIKIVDRLQAQRSPHLPPLQVCIEVNVSGEESKSGVLPDEIVPLAQRIVASPNLKLRGLMTIPALADDFDEQRKPFRALKALFDHLNSQGFSMDTLSMGMSNDFEAAIAEGATIIRIGTAVFQEHLSFLR